MRTDGHTIHGRQMTALHGRLESVKESVKKSLTKERIADALVCVSTVAVLALILDILATDRDNAEMMRQDIEDTCGFVRAKLREALAIMEISEADHMQRLKDSLRLLASALRK